MKKSVVTRFTSASLIASLLAPMGCSTTPKVVANDDSFRQPTAQRTASLERAKFVASLKRHRRPGDLRKKKPHDVLQTIFGKWSADGDSTDDTAKVPEDIKSPWVDPIEDAQIQSCLTTACGPASENWNASSVIARPGFKLGDSTPAVDSLWATDFESKVNSFYDRKIATLDGLASRIEKVVSNGITVPEKHPFLPFLSFMGVFDALDGDAQDYITIDPSGKLTFNVDAAKKGGNLSDAQIIVLKAGFEKFLLPMILASASANPMDNALANRLRSRYPGVVLVDAQKKDAKMLMDRIAEISTIIGPFLTKSLFDEGQKSDIKKASTGVELNVEESNSYADLANSIDLMSLVYFDAEIVAGLKSLPYDIKGQLAKFVSSAGPQIARILADGVKKNSDLLRTTTNAMCKLKLSASLELNASPLRYRKVIEAQSSIRKAAKTVVAKLVDTSGLDFATRSIDQVQFTTPASNEERIQSLRDGLLSEDRSLRADEMLLATQTVEADQFLLLKNLLDANKSMKTKAQEALSTALSDACDKLPIETASDYTLTSQGRISVSWFTANYPEFGVSVMAHEMGHMVSTIIRTEQMLNSKANAKFTQLRNCVANRSPYLVVPQALSDTTASKWEEEDWADRFSSFVMEELKRTGDSWSMEKNLGCALVGIDSGVYKGNKLAPAPNDVHSGGLLRTLMVGTDRETLPNQCKPLLIYATKANRQLECPY